MQHVLLSSFNRTNIIKNIAACKCMKGYGINLCAQVTILFISLDECLYTSQLGTTKSRLNPIDSKRHIYQVILLLGSAKAS